MEDLKINEHKRPSVILTVHNNAMFSPPQSITTTILPVLRPYAYRVAAVVGERRLGSGGRLGVAPPPVISLSGPARCCALVHAAALSVSPRRLDSDYCEPATPGAADYLNLMRYM